jgi:glucose-6-phosphate isomerase
MGSIWNIDPFDHWGLEPGKVLAQRIVPELESGPSRRSRTTALPII